MTCKDCLHHDVCYIIEHYGADETENGQEYDCRQFKDRTKWVEQKHGRWVERRHEGMGGGWYALFHCSECDTPSAKPRNFCSFCGAKMDGERTDNGNL